MVNAQNDGFTDYSFVGSQILGSGTCQDCGLVYFHNWPIGHGKQFPISFSTSKARYPEKAEKWLAKPVIKAVIENHRRVPRIARDIRTKISRALVINCLDPCYGHIILKLFNSWIHRNMEPPEGMVVVVPSNCIWMVPDFVSEIWSVEISLADLNSHLDSLRAFIDDVSEDYQSRQIMPLHTHPDHQQIDFSQYFRVSPFTLDKFYSLPMQVCFIWREDRYWILTRVEEMLSFISIKYSVKLLKYWLLLRQLKAITGVARRLKQQIPELSFKVVGLGTWGRFPEFIQDSRNSQPAIEDEISWCVTYAQSQLVVGVHGSGMMIPTALSGGFIELLPEHKIPFISEDILMKHEPRFQTFLGRHLDLFTTPKVVVRHIISVLKDFSYLYANTTASL